MYLKFPPEKWVSAIGPEKWVSAIGPAIGLTGKVGVSNSRIKFTHERKENVYLTCPTELFRAQFVTQALVILEFMWIFILHCMGDPFILIRSLRKELHLK